MFPDPRPHFARWALGAHHTLDTPLGPLEAVYTFARLGPTGVDAPRRLPRQLRPAHEILSPEDPFGARLTAALDPDEVTTTTLPDLLHPDGPTAAWLRPLVAVLLPVTAGRIDARLPPPRHDVRPDGTTTLRWGDALRWRRPPTPQDHALPGPAEVSWNEGRVRPILLTDPARGMALTATQRTLDRAWAAEGTDADRRHYEPVVDRLLAAWPDRSAERLARRRLPVVLTWPSATTTRLDTLAHELLDALVPGVPVSI